MRFPMHARGGESAWADEHQGLWLFSSQICEKKLGGATHALLLQRLIDDQRLTLAPAGLEFIWADELTLVPAGLEFIWVDEPAQAAQIIMYQYCYQQFAMHRLPPSWSCVRDESADGLANAGSHGLRNNS